MQHDIIFENHPKLVKLTNFSIFNEPLFPKNVNLARFARHVEWDFFSEFQTKWVNQTIVYSDKSKFYWSLLDSPKDKAQIRPI